MGEYGTNVHTSPIVMDGRNQTDPVSSDVGDRQFADLIDIVK